MGYKSTEPVCQVLVSMMLSEQTDSYDTEHSLFLGQDCSIGHGLNGHIWSSHLHAYLHSSARTGGGGMLFEAHSTDVLVNEGVFSRCHLADGPKAFLVIFAVATLLAHC